MTEIYNPRDRTFIKKPEVKMCVTCGQPLPSDVKPMTNHMNKYLNIISGKVIVVNSNENTLVIQGVTLYKVDGSKEGKEISSFAPVAKVVETPKVAAPTK